MQSNQGEANSNRFSFRDVPGALSRRRATILITLLVFVGLAVGVSLLTPPTYRSCSEVLIEDVPRPGPVDASDPLVALGAEDVPYGIPTHVAVLASSQILRNALDAAGLSKPDAQRDAPGPTNVEAEQVGDTNVVQIAVESEDPAVARKCAAALPYAYFEYIQAKRRYVIGRALEFVNGETRQETGALSQARAMLAQFEKSHQGANSNIATAVSLSRTGRPESNESSTQRQSFDASISVNRELRELERNVEAHENALGSLVDLELRLRLRNNSLKTPLSNITGETRPELLNLDSASPALQVAPSWPRNTADGAGIGLVLGCIFALLRDAKRRSGQRQSRCERRV